MIFSLKSICIVIVAIVGILLCADSIRFYRLIQKGKTLAKNAIPFERQAASSTMRILILGDSTAVGTGSERSDLSIAGRLSALYPEANIQNLAVNGLRLEGLLEILESHKFVERNSLIVVQIGANDIIRLTPMKDVERDIRKILEKLSSQTENLIFLHSGDIGETKIFPVYLRPFLTKRSFEMKDIYKKAASDTGAKYVDLIDSPSRALLRDYPTMYYSEDFLHLNAAGYGLWFADIKNVVAI